MLQTDDFSAVFRAVAAAEGVPEQRVSLCRGDDADDAAAPPVQPYDTPACIALRVTDILDAYIRRGGGGEGDGEGAVSREACAEDDPDAVALRVQGKDPKSRCSITVNKVTWRILFWGEGTGRKDGEVGVSREVRAEDGLNAGAGQSSKVTMQHHCQQGGLFSSVKDIFIQRKGIGLDIQWDITLLSVCLLSVSLDLYLKPTRVHLTPPAK